MKILYTSDIHASPGHLYSMLSVAEKEKADCIIVGGDLVPHYLPGEYKIGVMESQAKYLRGTLIPTVRNFKRKTNIPIYLDLANDDFKYNRSILESRNGELFFLLHNQKHPLTDTVDIIGYMNVPPTPFGRKDWEKPDSQDRPYTPGNSVSLHGGISTNGIIEKTVIDLSSDDTIENDLEQLSEMIENPFIFISHTPPYKTPLDVIYNGLHVGSLSVRKFIEKWAETDMIIASLHGHIHESPNRSGSVSTRINNILCVNPGQGSGDQAWFNYVILELSDDRTPVEIELIKSV